MNDYIFLRDDGSAVVVIDLDTVVVFAVLPPENETIVVPAPPWYPLGNSAPANHPDRVS